MTPLVLSLVFPNIDPVLIHLGPLAIRWYALAYIAGLFGGLWYMRRLVTAPPALMTPVQVDDLMLWVLGGIVLGGRLGYVLFYKPAFYFANPTEIVKTWEGGMSFHGGLLGVIVAIMLFARRNKLDQWYIADNIGCVVPIGLGLGRIANFINGELWGRLAPPDLPWGMIFPGAGPLPRHPSQLYQAFFEGLVLLTVMHLLWRNPRIRHRPGTLTGCFCIGYGLLRMVGEMFREPDAFIGFLSGGTTMGQWLSLPMVLAGLTFIWRAKPIATTA
ncbi:MAG: prolipoprotein diacylglyceryl transferase [Rhodospirillaceae bacterium]|nr:MAG: prolipoprotein diacylglyceryl transferase [Rhodospirillaceae bacterium]